MAACSSEAPGVDGVLVTDSAGVTVVSNSPRAMDAVRLWALSATPVVDIGSGLSPDVPLYRVADLAPLGGNLVAVATQSPPQIRIFDASGALMATLGGPGDGPGEFRRVTSVVEIAPDSVAALDPDRRRISVYSTRDGAFEREVDISDIIPRSPEGAGSTSEVAARVGLLNTGSGLVLFAVGVFGPSMADGDGVLRLPAPSFRISRGGDVVATFGPFPGEELFVDGQLGFAPYRFAASSFGGALDDRLVVGTAEASELMVFAPDGGLERLIRWPDRDRAVEGPRVATFEAWLADALEEQPPDFREIVEELLERMPVPERFPAYAGLVVSDAGEMWVGDYPGQLGLEGLSPDRPRVPERSWLVISSEGGIVGEVRTPEGFEPQAVRDGLVWGVHVDPLDVESVRAYGIER